MRIGELARKAGIRASAIRFYERAGVLPRASRQNGQRDFTPEAELYLAVIDFARRAGFTIAEIRLVFQGFGEGTPASARWRRLAQTKYNEIDLLISRMESMQKLLRNSMRCRCIKLEDCGRMLLSRRTNLRGPRTLARSGRIKR